MSTPRPLPPPFVLLARAPARVRARRQRGVGLIDAVIALVVLAFGLLAVVRLQGRTLTAATDAQLRSTATRLADELLGMALIDAGNSPCYTLPAAGTCNSTAARAFTTAWSTKVAAALPDAQTPTVAISANGRASVTIGWVGRNGGDDRSFVVVSDLRGN